MHFYNNQNNADNTFTFYAFKSTLAALKQCGEGADKHLGDATQNLAEIGNINSVEQNLMTLLSTLIRSLILMGQWKFSTTGCTNSR